ncbi:MAG: VIT domain-containing protein [Kofleriaceae bacterium]
MRNACLLGLVFACRTSPIDYIAPPSGSDGRVGLGALDAQLNASLASRYQRQVTEKPAPFSLTPGDGSELQLRSLDATITIDGPLAHTELRLVFRNTEQRIREGRFAIALPTGAAVGRFAMHVGNEWRESRIVARDQGRQVYERFLHRGVDPALLEQDVGERFSARVFPIAANEDKELIVGYDHVVDEHRPYTLALAGLPAIPRVGIAIDRDGALSKRELRDALPADVAIPIAGGSGAVAAGGAFVARVVIPEAGIGAAINRVVVAIDTSASRATVMGRQVDAVRRILATLPADTLVSVLAFDHEVSELYRGPAQGAGRLSQLVFEHGALGAADLGALLARAASSGMSRLVIVGDGVATLGETDPKRLATIVEGSPIDRIDAIQIGAGLDRDTFAVLVRAGKHPGAILDGRDPERVATQLQLAPPSELPIQVAGATTSFPATTRGVAPGDPIWVSGRREATGTLAITIGERTFTVDPVAGDPAHTRRTAARAELAALTERAARASDADRKAINADIEKLAVEHNLMSSRTSMIVFENDADEQSALGPRPDPTVEILSKDTGGGGELIQISASAPTIDVGSTTQGITIDKSYLKNIPVPGRTYEAALGASAGVQYDRLGASVAGSSSLENVYLVDGINTTALGPAGRRAHQIAGSLGASSAWVMPTNYGSEPTKPAYDPPYAGPMKTVMGAIASKQRDRALEVASAWQLANPGDISALLALGESLEARGATALAARAYGSIADLFPNRADLLRACGERLDRLQTGKTRALAVDVYRRALRERPDHASGYRLLAYALLRDGQADAALDALLGGISHATPETAGVMIQDARVVLAHLIAKDPGRRAELRAKIGLEPAVQPSLHVVLSWETDANDVDLHVKDGQKGHAFYSEPKLPSGGGLLHDMTDGWGPEMFVVENPSAFPYKVSAHYYRRGAMGIGFGTIQIIRHDGHGNIAIEDRPFAIQNDNAMIELGVIAR